MGGVVGSSSDRVFIECVPNFSEGRRPEVVAEIVTAIASVEGVRILDYSSDAAHNRSVVTLIGPRVPWLRLRSGNRPGAGPHRHEDTRGESILGSEPPTWFLSCPSQGRQ